MSLADQPLRNLALALLAKEADNGEGYSATAAMVCGKFGRSLSKVAGTAGFRSLLCRALALAQAEVPWLGTVAVLSDGQLDGIQEAQVGISQEEVVRGEVSMVAQLLGLLHAFIGAPLTLQLVREVWPGVSIPSEVPKGYKS